MEPLSQDLRTYFVKCTETYNAMVRRQNEVWGFDQQRRWGLDQTTGVLQVWLKDGRTVEADAEIVGSVCGASWEWAWNNANVDERMKPSSALFRAFGEKHGLVYYSTGMIPMVLEAQPGIFLSVACDLAKAEGVYVGDAGELRVCCLLRNIRVRPAAANDQAPAPPAERPGYQMRDDFRGVMLRGGVPEDMVDRFAGLVEPSVLLESRPVEETTVAVGACKAGGLPDLVPTIPWPEWKGKPLAFLAQVGLAEVACFQACAPLPATGLLSFFYDQKHATRGHDPADRGSWAVLFQPGMDGLVRRERPAGLKIVYPVCRLTPKEVASLPELQSLAVEQLDLSDVEMDVLQQICAQLRGPRGARHRLLGHPSQLQDDVQLGCQLAANGVAWGEDREWKDARTLELLPGIGQWRMLLQLDSDRNAGFAWPYEGRLFFAIRQQDLRARDFSTCWMIRQRRQP